MNRGYIKLFRKIEDCSLFMDDEEPFCKYAAWIDLLMMANHKDGSFILGMKKYNVKRGQKWTSITKLAERWHWCRKKVRAYLKLLESEGMVYLEITNKGLLITIVNYGVYQDFSGKTEQQKEQQKEQQRNIKSTNRRNSRSTTNNNVNNDINNDFNNELKNTKKPSADFDFLRNKERSESTYEE